MISVGTWNHQAIGPQRSENKSEWSPDDRREKEKKQNKHYSPLN